MSVTLRKRVNKDGTTTPYLDINLKEGGRKYEFLSDFKLFTKPKNDIEREINRKHNDRIKRIRLEREQQVQDDEYGPTSKKNQSIDFVAYFKHCVEVYPKKDKRILQACLNKFKEYLAEVGIKILPAGKVNEDLIIDYKDFLEANLNGETPANYFKKFKIVLAKGVKDKVLKVNPAIGISIKKEDGIKKDILNFEEIQQLADTKCGNEEVRRAFLFSFFTGLRHCDIINLKTENINGDLLTIKQQKTQRRVIINLHPNAIELLKQKKSSDYVFSLPSHTSCNKNLKLWARNAGLSKKVTWHVARHSFGTNLALYGADLNTTKAMLGHSSLNYTVIYVREADALKEQAVRNLPCINLNSEEK